jgi:hypothetical protein
VAEDPDEILTASDLGRKLVVALRSVTDPQALMQAISDRSSAGVIRELSTRIDAMEKATQLWHDDLVRVPTDVQKSVTALQALMEQFIRAAISTLQAEEGRELERIRGDTGKLTEVSEERFRSIAIQFQLLKQATEQLDIANKTAIAAALQAQKEQAAETQKTSQAAIAKSETSTGEAIKALTTNFNTAFTGIEGRINDLKGRMDRGEGQSGVSDPATARALQEMAAAISKLTIGANVNDGMTRQSDNGRNTFFAAAAILVSLLIGFGSILAAIFAHHG